MADATVAQVRVLIPDTDQVFGEAKDEYLFSDEQLQTFIVIGKGNALYAAGLAMTAVGNSEALISKVIVSQDLETDGAKVQKEWAANGARYIQWGRAELAEEGFEFFELVYPTAHRTPELTEPVLPWYLY